MASDEQNLIAKQGALIRAYEIALKAIANECAEVVARGSASRRTMRVHAIAANAIRLSEQVSA